MFETIECKSHEEWLAERLHGVGASESSALFGVNPFESLYSLWARKRKAMPMSLEESEAMEWGKRLEEPIALAYAEKTGRKLVDPGRTTILKSASDPWMFATLDRVIDARNGPGVLEIKTAGEFRREDWEAGEIPLNYQVQVQHQLAVTGYKWASIAVLIGGNKFGWKDVERNEAFIANLRAKAAEFWRMVEAGTPPAVDGSDHTLDALKALYAPDGSVIDLASDVQNWDDELARVKDEIKELEEHKDLLSNRIREAMGSASIGVLPCGDKWTLTTGPRAGYVVEPKAAITTFRRVVKAKAKGRAA